MKQVSEIILRNTEHGIEYIVDGEKQDTQGLIEVTVSVDVDGARVEEQRIPFYWINGKPNRESQKIQKTQKGNERCSDCVLFDCNPCRGVAYCEGMINHIKKKIDVDYFSEIPTWCPKR